jgi:homoserine O-succinyltransferase
MTLVAHSSLPTFEHLSRLGHDLLSLERARRQDIRELHIGFLNMMPDAALQATERQFIRLVGSCNRIAQFYVYPFSLPALERSEATRHYIDQHYSRFDDLKAKGLDALIITGANVANPRLTEEPFWKPLMEVVRWAEINVASVLCSCLATHALLHHGHGIERRPLPEKRWGVFPHTLRDADHPLVREINTRFDVPHSRYNDISREQFEAAGLRVLVESEEGGVHLAVSPDLARIVYFQGHPEYDRNSLLKEYQREVRRFLAGERNEPPPYPGNYFSEAATALIESAWRHPETVEAVLRDEVEPLLENTWGDTAKAVFNNWLGMVYQLTNLDRQQQYMPGVDRDDPLGLKTPGA